MNHIKKYTLALLAIFAVISAVFYIKTTQQKHKKASLIQQKAEEKLSFHGMIAHGKLEKNPEDYEPFLTFDKQVVDSLEDGFTPLMIAAIYNRPKAAELLIRCGANVNATREDNLATALHFAVKHENNVIVDILLQHGATTKSKLINDKTPLHYIDDVETAKLLLARGANANAIDDNYFTPLFYIAIKQCAEPTKKEKYAGIAQLLLKHGANADIRDKFGRTQLYLAAAHRMAEVAELLIEYGADVNAKIKCKSKKHFQHDKTEGPTDAPITHFVTAGDGMTALHVAATWGALDVVKVLVKHGADVNAKMADGSTALSMTQNQEMKQLLLEHGAK